MRNYLLLGGEELTCRLRRQLAAGALPELTQDEVDSLVMAAKPAPQRVFMKHMDGDDEY